jgi:hypothetical protein
MVTAYTSKLTHFIKQVNFVVFKYSTKKKIKYLDKMTNTRKIYISTQIL